MMIQMLLLNSDLYRIHMDNRVDVSTANVTYDASTKQTTFNMPLINTEDANCTFQ